MKRPAHGRRDSARDLVEVGALQHAVAVDVRVDEPRDAAALRAARSPSSAEHLRLLRPAGHRHPAAAHVHRRPAIRSPCSAERLVEQVRVREGGRAEHHPRGARAERAPDRRRASAARRRTAPARRARAAIRSQVVQVHRARPRARRRGRPRAGSGRPPRPTRAPPRADRPRRRSRRRSRPARRRTALPSRMSTAGSRIRRLSEARRRPRRCREVLEQPQAVRARLLRVELDAVERLALDRARRTRSPYSAVPSTVVVGGPRARTSARGRRRTGPGSPSVSARLLAASATAFQPICGHLQARRVERARPARAAARAPRRRPLARGLEQQLHAQADAEHRHAGREPLARAARRARARAGCSIAFGNAPTPGQHDAVGRAHALVVARSRTGSAPTCSSAFSTERRLPIP